MSRIALTPTNLEASVFDNIAPYQSGTSTTKSFIHSSMLGGI